MMNYCKITDSGEILMWMLSVTVFSFFFNRDSGDQRHIFYPFLFTLLNRQTNQALHNNNNDSQGYQRMRK